MNNLKIFKIQRNAMHFYQKKIKDYRKINKYKKKLSINLSTSIEKYFILNKIIQFFQN